VAGLLYCIYAPRLYAHISWHTVSCCFVLFITMVWLSLSLRLSIQKLCNV